MKHFLFILLIFSIISPGTFARERIALVIGNSDYQVDPLPNPVNDANDMAKVLGELGFEVTLKVDADQMTMESAIRAFGQKLHKDAVGLFYFSGHGAQYQGNNYLIPINSIQKTLAAEHLRYKAVPAGYVSGMMQAANNGLNIIILDACRDNPFKGFSKSLVQGLTRMSGAEGTLIAYATAPDTLAWSGEADERNSPYTKHLLRFIKQPNLTIEAMLKKVRKAVIWETRNDSIVQQPWYEASISDEFYFIENSQTPTPVTQPESVVPAVPTSPNTVENPIHQIHTVLAGETVYGIATKYGQTIRDVIAWNNLEPPYGLRVGQELVILPPPWYQPSINDDHDDFSFLENPQTPTTPVTQPEHIVHSVPTNPNIIENPTHRIHTVQAGETLYGIATKYGQTVHDIVAWNNIEPPYTLSVGQELLILPDKDFHIVQIGETLYSIVKRYGLTVRQVAAWNNFEPPYNLSIGQKLIILPHHDVHTIQKGETLYGIARQYGLTVEQIAAWNNLEPPYFFGVGQKLIVSPPNNLMVNGEL
jgi:LysM repeat protein